MSSDETLLEFPCQFPVKVFGKDNSNFSDIVYSLISPHAPDLKRDSLQARPSRGGRYLAVTANIRATSQAQLDAIYQALTDSDAVIMAL